MEPISFETMEERVTRQVQKIVDDLIAKNWKYITNPVVCKGVVDYLQNHAITRGLEFIWDGTLKINLEVPKELIPPINGSTSRTIRGQYDKPWKYVKRKTNKQ